MTCYVATKIIVESDDVIYIHVYLYNNTMGVKVAIYSSERKMEINPRNF